MCMIPSGPENSIMVPCFPATWNYTAPKPRGPSRPRSRSSRRYCRRLARRHYENFTVASWLLPRRPPPAFSNVYAYCRWADDLADEAGDPRAEPRPAWTGGRGSSRLLPRQGPAPGLRGPGRHDPPFEIPIDPLVDLLVAFRQDQRVRRYEDFGAVARILPLLGQPGRPAGPLPWAMPHARAGRSWPTRSARGCNWPISGRTWPGTWTAAASICRRPTAGGSAATRRCSARGQYNDRSGG